MKILVTGAGALLGQGVIRAARLSSLGAEIIAVDPSEKSVGLYWADRYNLILPASDPKFIERLREVLSDEHPDFVLVGTDVELPILAAERAALEAEFQCHVVVSDSRTVEIANDKWLTYKFLEENGLPRPRSCLPGAEKALISATGFPVVVKPRVGARSVGVHLIENERQLRNALEGQTSVVIQESVGDKNNEYTAGVVHFERAEPVSIVMRRELKDGNTYRAYVVDDASLNEYVRRVAKTLRPYGPVNFQFRLDGGEPKIFEINARFSGTTPMRARAGFNEVEMVIRHLAEKVPLKQPDASPVSFLRYWDDLMIPTERLERALSGSAANGKKRP
jgi:carbamoyl-phosphate synthase large subunit